VKLFVKSFAVAKLSQIYPVGMTHHYHYCRNYLLWKFCDNFCIAVLENKETDTCNQNKKNRSRRSNISSKHNVK